MRKPLLYGMILAIIGLVASFTYAFSRDDSNPAPAKRQESSQSKVTSAPSDQDGKGEYVDYTESRVASEKGVKVLFFHAPWCSQCRQLEASIKSVDLPDGLVIYKVDYDTNQDLRKKYGVTIQTTLVRIDDNGNQVKKYVAYQEPTFESLKQNLLE